MEVKAQAGVDVDDYDVNPRVDRLQLFFFFGISMTTMLDYQLTLRYLAYLGFEGDTTTAIKVTRPRKIDRRKGKVQRNVFLCYVFGAPKSGKVKKMSAVKRIAEG